MNTPNKSNPIRKKPLLSKILQLFLTLLALLCVWNSWELFNLSALASQQVAGNWSTDYADALYHRRTIAGSIQIICFLLTFSLFLALIYNTSRDLLKHGHELTFSPSWAVGSFFIPIYNLFKPLQFIREITSNLKEKSPSANHRIIIGWWFFSVFIFLSGLVTAWLLLNTATPARLVHTAWYRAIQELGQSGVSLLTIIVIHRKF